MRKYYHWSIAYKEQGMERFEIVPNPAWGWCADPFIIEYQGIIYLFAEIFLYKSERNGVIGYCTFENGKFGEWKVCMDEHWHLSYPNVFIRNNNLYMCPESYQKKEVGIYELQEFPDKWKKVHTLLENVKYVDSTFMRYKGKDYMFTFKPTFKGSEGGLLLFQIDENGKLSEPQLISDNVGNARPGGKVIYEGEKVIRVSQDSTHGYGYGLVFNDIISVFPEYREKEIKRITVKDIEGNFKRNYLGIHTYNRCGTIEVIDLKYADFSMKEYRAQKRVRKVFLNKYR